MSDVSPKLRKLSKLIGQLKESSSATHTIFESTTKNYQILIEPRAADGGANLSDLRILAEIRSLISDLEDIYVPLGRASPLEIEPKIALGAKWIANFQGSDTDDKLEAALKRLSRTQIEITEAHDHKQKVHRFSFIGGYSIFQSDEFDQKEVYISVPDWLLAPPEDLT